VRGSSVVNVNVIVADTVTEDSMLPACLALADEVFGRLPNKFTIAAPAGTAEPALTAGAPTQPAVAPQPAGPTPVVGPTWVGPTPVGGPTWVGPTPVT